MLAFCVGDFYSLLFSHSFSFSHHFKDASRLYFLFNIHSYAHNKNITLTVFYVDLSLVVPLQLFRKCWRSVSLCRVPTGVLFHCFQHTLKYECAKLFRFIPPPWSAEKFSEASSKEDSHSAESVGHCGSRNFAGTAPWQNHSAFLVLISCLLWRKLDWW